MRSSVLIFLLIFTAQIAYSQVKVVPASNSQPSTGAPGIFYALPMTCLIIDVMVAKTDKIPGPYNQYAEKYLGLENILQNRSTTYQIISTSISSFTRPDPSQYYFVEYDEKASKDEKSLSIALSEAGMIVGVNNLPEQAKTGKVKVEIRKPPTGFSELFTKHLAWKNSYEKVDTIKRRISIDTLIIEKEFYKSSWKQKSLDFKAKEASDLITRIKENRFLLISGYQEVNYGESIEYMDMQLQNLESDYLSLFTGVTLTSTVNYSFIFLPDPDKTSKPQPVFRFSPSKGIFDAGQNQGENVYIEFQPAGTRESITGFQDKKASLIKENRGYYYRVPEYATVQIRSGSETLCESNMLIDQFGLVSFTPILDPKIEFHQKTGGIKTIKIR